MRIESAIQNSYERLSSMRRINSAADDAAGMAISQQMLGQISGYDRAADNAMSMNDLAKTAEGALSSVNDNLQRMRELAVQASNGTLSADDRKIIQTEIDSLKDSINDVAKYTEFNTQKILDGTFVDKNIALNPSGTGAAMNIQNSGLEALGIKDFDVTGSFDISDIDNAMDRVSEAQSKLGATSNRLDYASELNQISEYNLTAANSRISDLNVEDALIQLSTNQILEQYKNYSQKQMMSQKANMINLLG